MAAGAQSDTNTVRGKVSVVGCYYNRAEYASASVQSLLAQDYADFEIVLIDDGSTDDTYEMLASIEDPRLRVVRQSNIGFVRSIRRAIEMTDGEYISVHGSGDIAKPQLLRRGAEVMSLRPDIGVVGTWIINSDPENPASGGAKRIDLGHSPAETLLRAAKLSHGGAMYRRALYDAVGGYRTTFTYAQDHDLWLRMSERLGIYVLEEFLYRRLMLPGGVSTSPEKQAWQFVLSQFAIYCAKERRATGWDPLDRYGEMALLLVPPSRAWANRFMSKAIVALERGDYDAARNMARLSRRGLGSPKQRLLGVMVPYTSRRPRLARAFIRLRGRRVGA